MRITMCKAKLHRATVTEAQLHYEGSITIDEDLLEASGILEYEKVQVVNINSGARFETYTYAGPRGSGMVCLNGAAARLVQVGDRIIVIAYCELEPDEAREHKPTLVLLEDDNSIKEVVRNGRHPVLSEHEHEC
ncbi:MAG TPA: aspartate 1-decarboxylase [Candidatus Sumerlaeota bacterium]|nr:MAG: Aspartate 1-decarboxylase precursor [candidate division BRC1 bacterium ADurb.BinA292]HOE95963.1 aspartate 1-decarboxylase [Candidatus Sumerlaeota bacterium]HOR27763.1 aspartate 1-decarboxylase [Candidatus Sumerlaeota bacterium]